MYIETVPNRNSRPAYLLRDAKRVGGRVVKRTLANLSRLPDDTIEVLRQSLKGVSLCDAAKGFKVKSTVPCGHVKAIRMAMGRLGMAGLVSSKPCRERDIVLALVAQRLIEPCSKLATSLRFRLSTVAKDFGLPEDADENDIYAAMDWLADRQKFIERKLAARHLDDGAMAFYDLSCSSCHGAHCELARRGYNRDGLKLPAIEYGLLTDGEGRPVSVQVYAGDTGDPRTVPDQAAKLRKDFGLSRVVVVGDRGMLTGARIEELREDGAFGWISCLGSDDIRRLLESRDPSDAPLFTREYIAEIAHPDFPGERLVACFNPFLKEDRDRTREELLAATERALAQLQAHAARRTARPMSDGELGERIGRRIARHRMAKHFRIEIGGGNFTFARDEESIRREQALDGIYVIRTSEPADRLSAADAVRAYKSLGNVEKSFRTFKGVDILVRPIHHRATDRVKAHIFLCMLTYYVEWHMRRALSPLMYAEDDLASARAGRDPVAKAAPTAEAKRKKATGLSRDGLPLNGWRGIIATLGTMCRATLEVGGTEVVVDAEPTEHQARIFGLLEADVPGWNWRRSQKPERRPGPPKRATP